ncbi:MAG: type II toxin-antitoxin system Phd/YefM family antitoxin [Planctomycetes bacterium]|nr:type II toxin-antitoxin system Phd/YefM family antitoxin [Planctomycetota bacterium]
MKVIDVEQAKANLEALARECQSSPVVVTVQGKPAFEMIPVRSDDPDFVDRLLETNSAFRELMERRYEESKAGKVSSLEDVRRRSQKGPG